ncbi:MULTISPECIES: polysaccharide biosynthesis C-terminal domain-containing protein [Acinetobacter]|uniref:Uncharacterized protein n=1 Tax=Acinetobacter higginsii TaxID=70347 RepID=N9TDH3_9GAMM|nr:MULTISPECIES: polysaccharide biosynthesis C-terminal domain-containing protein [Acinetobacter]ENX61612.1 hypothetical protein F902_00649 [Acinetobacter higginsii]
MQFLKLMINKFKNRIFTNSIWMMSEKLVSIFGLIFVTSFVAKYIGPENFGKLTLASSVFATIQIVAMFGSENIIFQKTAKDRKFGEYIISATKLTRDFIYITLSLITLIYIYIATDSLTFIFSLATSLAVYFAVHDVYSIYFNAILESKINAFCNILALITSLLIRYFIAKFQLAIELLCVPIVIITLLPFLLRKFIFNRRRVIKKEINNERLKKYRRFMLSVGGKLFLFSLSVAFFSRSSQLALGIKSQYELGLFTVVMTLGGSFYFVLLAVISSYFTKIYQEVNLEKTQKMVAFLSVIIICISTFFISFFGLFGGKVVNFLYGKEFLVSNEILILAVVLTMFSGLSTIAERYLLKFNAYDYLKKKTLYSMALNIILTIIFVYYWGLMGAMLAMLISEVIASTVLNYFYKNGIIFKMHKMIFSPLIYRKY